MNEPAHARRLRQLIDQACSDVIDAAELRELETLLRGDEAARKQYLELFHLQTELQFLLALERSDDAVTKAVAKAAIAGNEVAPRLRRAVSATANFFLKPTPLSLAVATLVLGVLITAMAIIVPPVYRSVNGFSAPRVVAELSDTEDAVWEKGQVGVHVGAHLVAERELRLERGLAEITYSSGAVVLLQGPATLILSGEQPAGGGTLPVGRLTAFVPPQARGFTIHSPGARIVDLGTEFGVQSDKLRGTYVEVFDGTVNVYPAHASSTIALTAGQSLTFSTRGEQQPLEGPAPHFTRQLPPRDPAWLIGYDGFDYARDQSIDGAKGGVGWKRHTPDPSQWVTHGNSIHIVDGRLVTQESTVLRQYGGLTTGDSSDQDATDERRAAWRAQGRLYYGVTMTLRGSPSWAGISSFDFGKERLFIGKPGNEANFGIVDHTADIRSNSAIAVESDRQYRLVIVFDYQQGEMRLWVTPDDNDFDRGAGHHTADATHPIDKWNWSTAVRLGSGDGGEAIWDDIIVCVTFASARDGKAAVEAALDKPAFNKVWPDTIRQGDTGRP